MEHAEQAILQGFGDHEDGARDVVGVAHETITWQGEEEGAVILGSSTICVGLLRPGGLLEIANVGDSGFRVVRGKETVFASEVRAVGLPCYRNDDTGLSASARCLLGVCHVGRGC